MHSQAYFTTDATCYKLQFPTLQEHTNIEKAYEPLFKKVIFCGAKENKTYEADLLVVQENRGYQGYVCLIRAIEKYPTGFVGYLYSNDDVILNFWNFNADPHKVWLGKRIHKRFIHRLGYEPPNWSWFKGFDGAKRCENVFRKINNGSVSQLIPGESRNTDASFITKALKVFKRNVNFENTKIVCVVGRSDLIYIPAIHSQGFKIIGNIYNREKVFLEIAVPSITHYLDLKENFINLNGNYYNDIVGYSKDYWSGKAFFDTHNINTSFTHPLKLSNPLLKSYVDGVYAGLIKTFREQCNW
uniref:Uncharacterized protein n=1 Tax=Clytia hemisphaerica TaxID=252671 RepID=A0A7M5UMU4_9CNID